MALFRKLLATNAPPAVILVRLIVGGVFLSEGIQKFLYPDLRGAGRFATLGIPSPEFFGPFVGAFEVVCGVLILLGLLTRLAVVPTFIIMLVAISTTQLPVLQREGFWFMANRIRTDYSMLLGSVFLFITGAGPWSLDAILTRRAAGGASTAASASTSG
jgi:uncharacterized membrane protein YphA (DoxX/SURF4 family)